MSGLASPTKSSPYGAPHTPIASAKRTSQNSSSGTLPVACTIYFSCHLNAAVGSTAYNDSLDERLLEKYLPALFNFSSRPIATALFSPALKFDDTGDKDLNVRVDENARESNLQADDTKIEDEVEEIFNPYLFIANLPPHESVRDPSKICLPPALRASPELTLVLDLDETLVHCTVDPIENPDLVFPVNFNGTLYQVHVRKRPYLDYFLESVSKSFELVVFTASQSIYANALLDLLDPNRYVRYRLFREACLCIQGNYLKDLDVLGRDLRKVACDF